MIGKEFVVKDEPLSPPPPQRASVLHKNYSLANVNTKKRTHDVVVKEEPTLNISEDEEINTSRYNTMETLSRMELDESSSSSGGSFIRNTVLKRVRNESGNRVAAKKRTISLQELVDARNGK